jgi:hypothetical protein
MSERPSRRRGAHRRAPATVERHHEHVVAYHFRKAQECLRLHRWSEAPSATPRTREVLQYLSGALDSVFDDPAAGLLLWQALGRPTELSRFPAFTVRDAVDNCLQSLTASITPGKRKDPLGYEFAVKHLVLAWEARHGRQPSDAQVPVFRDFARAVTSDCGFDTPGGKHVRRWRGRLRDLRAGT